MQVAKLSRRGHLSSRVRGLLLLFVLFVLLPLIYPPVYCKYSRDLIHHSPSSHLGSKTNTPALIDHPCPVDLHVQHPMDFPNC